MTCFRKHETSALRVIGIPVCVKARHSAELITRKDDPSVYTYDETRDII